MLVKNKRGIKKALTYGANAAVAAVCLSYLAAARIPLDCWRYSGMIKDKYAGLTLEQTAEKVKTWEDCENYLMAHLRFSKDDFSEVPEYIHEIGRAQCFGAAKTAKKLLEDNLDTYDCFSAIFYKNDEEKHCVAIVKDKKTKKYGSLGINAADCIRPEYKSLDTLIRRLNFAYVGRLGKIRLDVLGRD